MSNIFSQYFVIILIKYHVAFIPLNNIVISSWPLCWDSWPFIGYVYYKLYL